MDHSRGRLLIGLVLLAVGTLVFGIPSHGDSYRLQSVSGDAPQGENFYGIDNVGNFVVECMFPCDFVFPYETYYVRTGKTVFSDSPPSLHWDNGDYCGPNVPGLVVNGGACNNGHEIFGALDSSSGVIGVWTGPDPLALLTSPLAIVNFNTGRINRLGDAVFDEYDPYGNRSLCWAEDLTTSVSPEPGTLLLVGSGAMLVVAGLLRKSFEKGRRTRRLLRPS